MIKVTERAAKKIKALKIEEDQDDSAFLRISVKEGGCSGWSYKLAFDQQLNDKDKAVEVNGQKVVVDSKSMLYLLGLTLDFEGGLNGKGFIFDNPNAAAKCGCGTSFAV